MDAAGNASVAVAFAVAVAVAAAASSSRAQGCLLALKRSVSPESNQHFHFS